MGDSFQNEIPKGRVNLTVEIQTNGAAKTVELPHKTLVIADFSNGKSKGPLLERQRRHITQFTRDSVMSEINPELRLQVENKISNNDEEMLIPLSFKNLRDFHPEAIVEQVPSLKRLLAMRNLLKELRSNIIDNGALKAKLAEILADEESRKALKQSLNTLLPSASEFQGVIMQQEVILQDLCAKANIDLMSAPKMFNLAQYSDHNTLIDIPSNERTLAAIGVLLDQVTDDSPSINKVDKALIDHYISRIDEKMSEQLDAIMHHEDFQSLEARWRGLDYLLTHSDPASNVKVELIDVSKEDLLADFEDAPDTTHSGLYQHVYTQEYDTPGGEPFSVIISDYEFDKSPQDIVLLRELSKVSSASHCPFISNIGPQFFDKKNFDEVMKIKDMTSYMEKAEYIRWQTFRKTEDSRYIGLVMPKFLLRLPYGDETEKVKSFGYRESVVVDQHKRYLWGAASFAFAANMARSFKKHGWTLNVRGPESGGKLEFLPLHQYDLGSGIQTKIPTEISIP